MMRLSWLALALLLLSCTAAAPTAPAPTPQPLVGDIGPGCIFSSCGCNCTGGHTEEGCWQPNGTKSTCDCVTGKGCWGKAQRISNHLARFYHVFTNGRCVLGDIG